MTISTKRSTKKILISKLIFAGLLVTFGIMANYFQIGQSFGGFSTLGSWLIYCGFLITALSFLLHFRNRNKIVDERMEKNAYKAYRWTFSLSFLAYFILIIVDNIQPIAVDSLETVLYFNIMFLLLVYSVSYFIIDYRQ